MSSGLRVYEDAVAIVTGGASGIGRALSAELAGRGCTVVIADIDGADAEIFAAELRAKGQRASAESVDVAVFAEVERLVGNTLAAHGRLDYYFNNAGIGTGGEIADLPLEGWTKVNAVNVIGVMHGVQAAYPKMVQQGYGHIVNTASMAGLVPLPGMASYVASKHAVVGLTRCLRVEAQCRGVRASVLCPGVIRTPLLEGGRHGVLLKQVSENRQRAAFKSQFERLRPMDAEPFARKVIDQVARNKAYIIVPGWWKLAWWLERLSPSLSMALSRAMFERERQGMRKAMGL